ncbi:MAG TPA: hypothetical protein VJZ06_04945 [Mobilitalea sp.]|nr:hypothetical protein [Mobilitalea sp.]
MSNNANIVISKSLMTSISRVADQCLNSAKTIDNGIVEIGFIVDAYNEYFYTGRGKVSKEGAAKDE